MNKFNEMLNSMLTANERLSDEVPEEQEPDDA